MHIVFFLYYSFFFTYQYITIRLKSMKTTEYILLCHFILITIIILYHALVKDHLQITVEYDFNLGYTKIYSCYSMQKDILFIGYSV